MLYFYPTTCNRLIGSFERKPDDNEIGLVISFEKKSVGVWLGNHEVPFMIFFIFQC